MQNKNELFNQFGARIREMRKAYHLSQEELAAKAQIDRTYLSDIELGKTNVSLQHISALADAFGVSVAVLFNSLDLNDTQSILRRWRLSEFDLTEVIDGNPSLRGMLLGYVGEFKLRELLAANPLVTKIEKPDDHDRTKKYDLGITYRGVFIRIEVKSIQTNLIRTNPDGTFSSIAQVDASDRRKVIFTDGSTVETTCLLRGEFDILAVNLYHFQKQWEFAFATNLSLPSPQKYASEQNQQLIASSVRISYPIQMPFSGDIFGVLDKFLEI